MNFQPLNLLIDMNSELLKHTSESTQILVLTWVLMGIRVPISFQSGFSKEEGFRVTGVLKTFKDKLFRGYIPPKPVARPGFEPGLFSSKGRRVASYTIGQSKIAFAKMERKDKIFIDETAKSEVLRAFYLLISLPLLIMLSPYE